MSYAPAAVQPALAALFLLDEKFGEIVGTTTETMIGLMRLTWWREALEKLDHEPAPAEPLLQRLAADVLPRGVSGAMLAGIEDGWSALLDGDADADAIARFGRERGGTLFDLAARLLEKRHHQEHSLPGEGRGPSPAAAAGENAGDGPRPTPGRATEEGRLNNAGVGWALADLAHRHSSPAVRDEARRQAQALFAATPATRWPKALRPLGALAVLARRDAAREGPRHQGSPGRLARMLALRITGR